MSSTLRCLSLLGCLLSVACSERASSASESPAAASAAEHLPKKQPPQLTSTLPSAPGSVADAPDPALAAQPVPETQPALADAADPPHDEPDLALDRPLDPTEVRVDRFVLAAGVTQREPLGETDVFTTETERVYAFVQLANEKEPYAVKVHFEPAEGPASPYGIALLVPTAPRHRTWAFTRIRRAPGRYRAVLRTLDGQEIARREFLIEDLR